MAYVDQWTEVCLVDIARIDDATGAYQFASLTDTIDISGGAKGIETTATCSGGRVVKYTPETDTSVKLELIPVGTQASATPSGLSQWFMGSVGDAVQPLWTANSRTRFKFRVAVLWVDDTTQATASGATTAAKAAFRMSFWGAYLTECTFAFTDDLLTCTATFTVPAFNKSGTGMIVHEECDGSATKLLPALGTYDTAHSTPY